MESFFLLIVFFELIFIIDISLFGWLRLKSSLIGCFFYFMCIGLLCIIVDREVSCCCLLSRSSEC